MNIHLARFLQTGALPGIALGESYEAIGHVLGKPASASETADADILAWGPLQLTFQANRLSMIRLAAVAGSAPLPEPLERILMPSSTMPLRTLLRDLDKSRVTWLIDEMNSSGKELCVVTEGGVRIFYDIAGWQLKSMANY